jgi:hypothetical protein
MADSPAEADKRDRIRKRKNLRLIERKKLDAEAKDAVMAPSDSLPPKRQLGDHYDFLAVLIFLMDLEEMVLRKEWGSAVEAWVFRQFERGSRALSAFNVYLKSGLGLQPNSKCYFRDFRHFRETIIRLFFTSLKDPIMVIENSVKRIKLTQAGPDGPTTPTTLEGFCNTLRFLFNQAPEDALYPERQQVARIRERLPKQVEVYLLEWEVSNNQVVNRYDVLMPCLHRQDVLFADSLVSKGASTSSNKRPANDTALQVAEVVGDFKKGRKVDNRPLCSHCSKPGHSVDACWMKYPEKKKTFHSKGRAPHPVLPLHNITSSSLESMIAKAVEGVIAKANHS